MGVAERMYARALFDAAQDAGKLEAVQADLGTFVEALDASPELQAFLENPQIDPPAKSALLGELTDGGEDVVRNFLRLTADKGRAGDIPAIQAEFEALVDRAQGRIAVELTTAQELSDDEAAALVRRIEEASGRAVEATRSVDPGLVGGLILQIGSLRVDASVRGRIDQLRRTLVTELNTKETHP